MPHTCSLCGHVVFATFVSYQQHRIDHHNAKPEPKVVLPVKTTSRNKAQIVHDTEKTWGAALIPENKPWHSMV
jgi:hypothetical protein